MHGGPRCSHATQPKAGTCSPSSGGLKVAEKVMTEWLLHMTNLYYFVTKSTWSWYTNQRKYVKNANHGVMYFVKCARGDWTREIVAMINDTMYTKSHLIAMGLDWGASEADAGRHQSQAHKVLDMTCQLASNRSSMRHHLSLGLVHCVQPHIYKTLPWMQYIKMESFCTIWR